MNSKVTAMKLRLFLVPAIFVVSALALAEPLGEDLEQLDVAEAGLNQDEPKVAETPVENVKSMLIDAEEPEDAKLDAEEPEDAKLAACPSGWKSFHGNCYKFASERRTWADSRAQCKSAGGDLVKISSTAENKFVANNKKGANTWLGLHRGSDDKFYWTDGTRVVFTSWVPGEPNNKHERCVHMWAHVWNDLGCHARLSYVCEKITTPACQSLKLRPNVQVTPSNCTSAPVPYSKVCSFRCPRGYRLQGPSSKRCTANGQWTNKNSSTTCNVTTPACQSLKLRPNVQVTPSNCTSAPVPYSKVCSFRCPRGYRLQGPSSKRCTANGQWTNKNSSTTCNDINECKVNNGGCSHQCVNSIGKYHCACPDPELKLDQNKHTCVASGTKITCGHDQIRIVIPKSLLAFHNKEDLTLMNKSCGATENSTHFSLVTSLADCGTVAKETKDKIVYTNKVLGRAISKGSTITRVRPLEIQFSCSYSRREVVSAVGLKPDYRKLKFRERANGSFSLTLDIFPDNKFRKPYKEKDYPVSVKLRPLIYIQASIKSVDKQLSITTDRCFATPSPDSASKPLHLLINNRCPVDGTVNFLRSPTRDLRRFSVKAFKFVGPRPLAFIHCDIVVCNASDVTSVCAKQCQSRSRGKRDTIYHEIHTVTRGPLIVFDDETQAQLVNAHRKKEMEVPISSQADETDEKQGATNFLRTT